MTDQPPEPTEDVLWTWSYLDTYGPAVKTWTARRVVRRTARYVFVDDFGRTIRLDRESLERAGEASSREHRETFYTPEAKAREEEDDRRRTQEARMSGFKAEMATGARVLELGAGGAFDLTEVAPGILKMKGFDVYVHDGRTVDCPSCGGTQRIGRRKCRACRGGKRRAMEVYRTTRGINPPGFIMTTFARDMSQVREDIARHPDCHAEFLCSEPFEGREPNAP